jgi:hypothetical protein
VGLAETQRSVIGRELAGEPWGTVWIYCSYPVVAAGLRSIFEKRTRVHVGLASPAEGAVPSCAIFDAGSVEVRRRAFSVSGGSPGNPDPRLQPACGPAARPRGLSARCALRALLVGTAPCRHAQADAFACQQVSFSL